MLGRIWHTTRRFLALITDMRHSQGTGSWLLLNRTLVDYGREVRADANSIIMACVGLIQRVFSEAPLMIQEWLPEQQEWNNIHRDDLLDLLERPNGFYNGTTLWKATIADYRLNGTAYWIKVRARTGRVVQLWWAPSGLVEPKADSRDPTVFISHYEYRPGGTTFNLRVEDVVQFRDGIDPSDTRKGLGPIKPLLREIFTDDEAANMTASLLRNMGVPGVVIAPKSGRIGPEAAARIKKDYLEKFTGDKRGEPLVMEGDVGVTPFGFSPEQMQLRELRGIPEERITAVLGVNAAVAGLGSGLASTKVGATLKEYGEQFFEFSMAPLYREMAGELTQQLMSDFKDPKRFRLAFDMTQVRVLQHDEMEKAQRVTTLVNQGVLTIAEGRRFLGWPVKPEHELYLRPANVIQIPTGLLRIQEGREPEPLPAPQASLNGNAHAGVS